MAKTTKKELQLDQIVEKDTKQLIVREGDAAILREKVKVVLDGTITAPGNFADARKSEHEKLLGHITWSKRSGIITLQLDEEDYYGKRITGKLVKNPDFIDFGINSTKKYTSKELQKKVRMSGLFFADRDQAKNLSEALAKVQVKVQKQIEEEFSNRGDSRGLIDVKVDSSGIPLEFTLNLPYYIGERAIKVKVEICIEVREKAVEYWLESPELVEAIEGLDTEVFDRELKRLSDYVLIEQ